MQQVEIPTIIDPANVNIILVSEGLPENPDDYFYTASDSLYVTNTIGVFNQAGIAVNSIQDIVDHGVYLTTAVKAPRTDLTFPATVIREHSHILEQELAMFPNVGAILLMGDAAIKALNYIAKRKTGQKAIPSGSTYKIRGGTFYFQSIRVFPSYLQTGKNFLIEKSKRQMVAEDLQNAFGLLGDS